MKFMKAAAGLVAAGLALTLSACGGSPAATTTSAASTQSASGPVEITVWAWEPTLKDVVTAFEKANPDIKVQLKNDDEDVFTAQIEREGSHSPADVFSTENSNWPAELDQKGLLAK